MSAMSERLADLWGRWQRPILIGLSAVGIVAVPYITWINRAKPTFLGFDAYAYWSLDLSDPYGVQYMDLGSFRYTPAFAQAFSWLGALPWELYLGLVLAGMLGILVAWGRMWALALIAFPPVALELYHGNIDLFIAFAMVLGLRYPVAWVFPILSKVTPGIALLWFVGRRDWRSLAIALGATATVIAISFALAPQLWAQWIQVMRDSLSFVPPRPYPINIPFLVRAPIAAAHRAVGRLHEPVMDHPGRGSPGPADRLAPRALDPDRCHPSLAAGPRRTYRHRTRPSVP